MGQAPSGSAGPCLMAVIIFLFQIRCCIAVVGGSFDGAAPNQDVVDEIPHHVFERWARLEFFGGGSSNHPLCKSIWVVHEAVDDENVDCHHENGADGIKGVRKEVFHPGVKINGF